MTYTQQAWWWVAALVTCVALAPSAQVPPASRWRSTPSPLSENCHPRLLITCGTTSNLSVIRSHIARGGVHHRDFGNLVEWADDAENMSSELRPWSGDRLARVASLYGVICATFDGTAGVPGVRYGHAKSQYCRRGRDVLMTLVQGHRLLDVILGYSQSAPLSADWLFDTLSPGDRQTVWAWYRQLGAPNTPHPFNSQFVTIHGIDISMGLAYIGSESHGMPAGTNALAEDLSLGDADSGWPFWAASQQGFLRSESDHGGLEGGYTQGDGYRIGYVYDTQMLVSEQLRRALAMSKGEFYQDDKIFAAIRSGPTWITRQIMPMGHINPRLPGGYEWRLWNRHFSHQGNAADLVWNYNSKYWYYQYLDAIILSGWDNRGSALAHWMMLNRTLPADSAARNFFVEGLWPRLIAAHDTRPQPPQSPDALGLPLNAEAKIGYTQFRSPSWAATNGTVVWTESTPFQYTGGGREFPNHPGHFGIFRNGNAVGYMRGSSGRDVMQMPFAGNVLVAVDRTVASAPEQGYDEGGIIDYESFPVSGSRDFYQPDGVTPRTGTGRERRAYRITRISNISAPKIHYQKIDHSLAYNAKVATNVLRRFAYCEPYPSASDTAKLLVFDRMVTTDTRHEKRWLLNPSGEITVNFAGTQTAGPSRGGTTHGKTTFTAPAFVRSDVNNPDQSGYNNTLYWTPLSPPVSIVRVGGPSEPRPAGAGSSASTLVLHASDEATDNMYVGRYVHIVGGAGAGQRMRLVTHYVGATRTATVTPPWSSTPVAGNSQYAFSFVNKPTFANPSREPEGLHGDLGVLFNQRRYDVDHPPSPASDWIFHGEYRLEAIPVEDRLADHFLNAIEVGDYNDRRSPTVLMNGTSNAIGATVGACGAVFGTGPVPPQSLTFRLETPGTFRVLVDWLPPSVPRTVQGGENIRRILGLDPAAAGVAGNQSVVITTTPEGTMVIEIVVGAAGTGPANSITIG